jgi:hypothetical protein
MLTFLPHSLLPHILGMIFPLDQQKMAAKVDHDDARRIIWLFTCIFITFMVPTVGNVVPRYQVGSNKADTSKKCLEGWHKKQSGTDDIRKCKSGYFTAFGVDLSPDNMAVAIVYFVQGVLGLARLAVSFYLKDDLHLDPAEVPGAYYFPLHILS